MRKRLLATLFLSLLLSFSASAAHAAVITFDNPALPNCSCGVGSYQESGLSFDGRFGHVDRDLFPGQTPFLDFANSSHLVVSTLGGDLFSLNSVDLGEYSSVFAGRQLEITILGQKADDSFVSQTFQIDGVMAGAGLRDIAFETFVFSDDFKGLKAAYFENTSSRYVGPLPVGYPDEFSTSVFSMDNLSVTAVPVPAAAWLFASGLGLLGWMRRRSC